MRRTFIPPTSFISSPEMEKERFLYHAASLAEGFYFRHQFLITPKIITGFNKQCVVMPEVLSVVSNRFWQEAKIGGQSMPKVLSKLMWQEFEKTEFPAVNSEVIKNLAKDWRKVEKTFWEFIEEIFPKERKWVGELEVRVTKLGGMSSHYLLTKKRNQKLIINVREDGHAREIASLVILSLIWPMKNDLNLSFNKRMVLRDFLMSRTEMTKLFPDWNRINYENIQVPESLRKQSNEYIEKLGIPRMIDPVEIIEKNWPIFGGKETKFLRLLIKNRGELVSYDQIADEIWGNGEFKTYWAINKIYQRVEKKIKGLGIESSGIKGFRGRGYKLG